MEIKPFKMKVTPEQSRIVQQTLFNNNHTWFSGDTTIENLSSPHLYFYEDILRQTENFQEDFFVTHELPELTFQEFFDRYVKWCVRLTTQKITDAVNSYNLWKYGRLVWDDNDTYTSRYITCDREYAKEKDVKSHIELTFEQFEKYVLKSKENKVMEKKIIGYKLKEDCKKYIPALDVICSYFADGAYKFEINSTYYEEFKKAGVLDLWFEPVYEKSSKELYFGKVKFTINKGYDFATTEYGKVTKKEIETAINYIENPPKLNSYTLGIRMEKGTTTYTLDIIEKSKEGYIAFGCQEGTYKELKEIYNAFE